MGNGKVMTAKEAVERFLHPGDMVAFGGFVVNRRPFVFVREIIRQKKGDLYVEGGAAGADIDMLIGAGLVKAINACYVSLGGFSMIARRYADAIVNHQILAEDYSMDIAAISLHGAALGMPYVPVKNMLGSDLEAKWGISGEERKKHPKLSPEKFLIRENPFSPEEKLLLMPTPRIDVAFLHVHTASPDGTLRILGPTFSDEDLAMAAKHVVVSCEQLVPDEEIRKHPEQNTVPGVCVDAVIPAPYGATPSQCFSLYDYDADAYTAYAEASKTQEGFDAYAEEHILRHADHQSYLDALPKEHLQKIRIAEGKLFAPGLYVKKQGKKHPQEGDAAT